MEPDEVQPRPRHPRGQTLHELQRAHHHVRGAVAPGHLQLQLHLPGGVKLNSLLGQRRPGDVAAQLLQSLALMSVDPARKWMLAIHRRHHGNVKTSVIDADILVSVDYRALTDFSQTVGGLIGVGAEIRRGEGEKQ